MKDYLHYITKNSMLIRLRFMNLHLKVQDEKAMTSY